MENKIYSFLFIFINQLFITIHKVYILLHIHERLCVYYEKINTKKSINIHSNFIKNYE